MAKARPKSELPRTVEEFDRWHKEQPERWELIAGVPVMMAPAANRHSIIKGNIFAALFAALRGKPCRPIVDGPEVRSDRLAAVPDVVVTCAPIDERSGVIDHPTALVEVLSPSSERDDTGRKWQGYCLIPSVQHYLVVSQEEPFATLHTRTGPSSFEETVHREGTLRLMAIDAILTFDEIYSGVDFSADEPEADA